ncbi:MAG: prolipoprotein diacylglyceryl transferase [Candidatus Wallbacteria bacterium]|nr:prolipoprotein diacylglyceryl transferase [Candidatus Wallbacteria bacterium]
MSLDFSGYLLQAVPDVYPVLLTLGSWRLYAYDAMLVAAFLAAIELGNRRCRQRGLPMPVVYRGEILLFLSGYFGSQLLELGMAWRGGYPGWLGDVLVGSDAKAFYSGFLAAFATCWLYCLVMGLPFPMCAAIAAPSIALGQAIGRLGCLLAGCCYGGPSTLPWAVAFPLTAPDSLARHPTQLYEAGLCLLLFAVLTWYYAREFRPTGGVIALYSYGYGFSRFGLELLRDDPRGPVFFGMFSVSQVIALVVISLALPAHLWLLWRRRAP